MMFRKLANRALDLRLTASHEPRHPIMQPQQLGGKRFFGNETLVRHVDKLLARFQNTPPSADGSYQALSPRGRMASTSSRRSSEIGDDGRKLLIINGSPGSGKSSFLQNVYVVCRDGWIDR